MCTDHDVDNNTETDDPRSGYTLVSSWPKYPAGMHFEMGSGIAVDEAGVIYAFTRDIEHWATHPLAMADKMGKSSISMFNREGEYLGIWGPLGSAVLHLAAIRYTLKKMACSGRLIAMGTP